MAGISVGYDKFPSIRISTLFKTGNVMGVNTLYLTPFWKRMVESVVKFAKAAFRPGESSFPSVCGTTNVCHAETTQTWATRRPEIRNNIFVEVHGYF